MEKIKDEENILTKKLMPNIFCTYSSRFLKDFASAEFVTLFCLFFANILANLLAGILTERVNFKHTLENINRKPQL